MSVIASQQAYGNRSISLATPHKEGYEFVGWYKDLEGTEPWSFENDIIPEKIYDGDGNYIFIETKIYAKWRLLY